MAHMAKLDDSNIVTKVLRTSDSGDEGLAFLTETFGGRWIKTSYNGTIRKHFARIGSEYREDLDAFVLPKPYPSWVLNEELVEWEPPIPYPTTGKDGVAYAWNEETTEWVELDNDSNNG